MTIVDDNVYLNTLTRIVAVMLAHAPRFKEEKFKSENEYRLFVHDLDPVSPNKNLPQQSKILIGNKRRFLLKFISNDISVTPGKKCILIEDLKKWLV